MNKRALLYFTLTICILVILLAFITAFPSFQNPPPQPFLHYNDIRGSAVEYQGLLYTLNFEQQNKLIAYLNSAIAADQSATSLNKPPYTKLIIYRFDLHDIEIIPLGYTEDNLVFVTPLWNNSKPLIDTSKGQLRKLLETTYD